MPQPSAFPGDTGRDGLAPVLVSACLAGVACRYDGRATPQPLVLRLVEQGRAVAVCPEVLGGLSTPREPVELRQGRALDCFGVDVTAAFYAGAQAALELGLARGCRRAILKARSPSCGCGQIYDGGFCGRLVTGDGIFAALLKERGLAVCTEEELADEGSRG